MRKPLRPEELFDATLALRERAEKAEAEVERLKLWKDTLISNLMALEIYEHKHDNDPAVALACYGQWNFKHGEWETKANQIK